LAPLCAEKWIKTMESYLPISFLNDFIFCPLSIYYHQLYGGISDRLYQELPQIEGKAAHKTIDEKKYSTRKNILQGHDIFISKYNLCGKIDIFNIDTGVLTERKKHITRIYDGYVFQLYSQYYGLKEMGYKVTSIRFYSMDDNKVYKLKLPDEDIEMKKKFEKLIGDINAFNIDDYTPSNWQKCQFCIYETLCDRSLI